MQKRYVLLALAAALIVVPTALQAASDSPWIHIQVREDDGSQTKVDVNLPLSVVQVALDVAPDKIISNGRIKIDHHGRHDLSIADLRRMWVELRDAGEAEFVTVEEEDEKVKVTREGDYIRVDVEDRSHHSEPEKETVRIKVPVSVVDALMSGEGEELNLRDALELLKNERGEIVRVEGGDSDVRIWIDERKSAR
jgi:hypothetical protein